MARTIRLLLPGLFLLLAAVLNAQTPAQPGAAVITLGQAAAPLYGPWKFTVGDSPVDQKTGKPLWAEPDFDDSRWETVDLTPKQGAIDPSLGVSGYVPGWTARGHAGYWGYAWYRIRVHLETGRGQNLALAGPADLDDAYQAFANGELLGSFGRFSGNRPTVYYAQPVMFPLPRTGNESGATVVLAFRFWMDPATPLAAPDAGGMHNAPVLGEAGVVGLVYQSRWLELVRLISGIAVEAVVFGVLAILAFSLILFDRSDRAYVWMGLLFLLIAANSALIPIAQWTQLLSIPAWNLLRRGVLMPLQYAAWVIVWWVWFGRAGFRWLPRVVGGLTLLLGISWVLADEVFFGIISHPASLRFHTVNLAIRIVLFGLLAWIVIEGIRRRGLDGWLVLPVVVLRGVGTLGVELSVLHVRTNWFPFGVSLGLVDVTNFLLAAVIALLLLRRLLQSVKRQREMALDVRQAQEVQEVILPEHRIVLPGLEIESEYRPAREVGGDFFQIVPHAADGSLLIVAGDVAGKGLKAGMLVALLVGAIRTAARFSLDPAEILGELNQRLLGRGDARATCLALRIARDGTVTLANAGHLPPYLNGAPMEIGGSLPLGILERFDCSVLQFQLSPSDRLLLLSDGVAEATNEDGKLFGFDRVLELVRAQPSAEEIANAAQAFGQEDDISVISVTRVAVTELAAQPALA